MGMTWSIKVQRVAFATAIVSALAMASGADFVESFTLFARLWAWIS
jgi:hypothetical protein